MSCVNPQPWVIPPRGSGLKALHLESDYSRFLVNPYGRLVYLPCGHCLQCEIAKRKDLTVLQCLEASQSLYNWFVTLTYDDEHLPLDGSLVREHLSLFCESMRKALVYRGVKFRYLAVGEYGDVSERPHYHLSVFNLPPSLLGLDFQIEKSDLHKALNSGRLFRPRFSNYDSNGNFFWTSPIVSARWFFGSHKIYLANKDTFQYVAGYVTKKLGRDRDYGSRLPEFRQSSRPAIGRTWYNRFGASLCQFDGDRLYRDSLAGDFGNWRIPRTMLKWIAKDRGDDYLDLISRAHNAEYAMDTPDRLHLDLVRRHGDLVDLRHKQNTKQKGKL